mmetsp:Transcript_106240/g.310586  ORF Transcript_106240/g.310586 Transcript_106240/m.310586 type:complete len:413 (-) Transcript_106240:21-1259(-)
MTSRSTPRRSRAASRRPQPSPRACCAWTRLCRPSSRPWSARTISSARRRTPRATWTRSRRSCPLTPPGRSWRPWPAPACRRSSGPTACRGPRSACCGSGWSGCSWASRRAPAEGSCTRGRPTRCSSSATGTPWRSSAPRMRHCCTRCPTYWTTCSTTAATTARRCRPRPSWPWTRPRPWRRRSATSWCPWRLPWSSGTAGAAAKRGAPSSPSCAGTCASPPARTLGRRRRTSISTRRSTPWRPSAGGLRLRAPSGRGSTSATTHGSAASVRSSAAATRPATARSGRPARSCRPRASASSPTSPCGFGASVRAASCRSPATSRTAARRNPNSSSSCRLLRWTRGGPRCCRRPPRRTRSAPRRSPTAAMNSLLEGDLWTACSEPMPRADGPGGVEPLWGVWPSRWQRPPGAEAC